MSAIIKRKERFVETAIDDEVVVMKLDAGDFFSLTGTGVAVWRLIDGSRDREALIAALADEYAIPTADIAGDVDEFLAQLGDAGLLEQG